MRQGYGAIRGIPVGRQFASGSSFDSRLSMSALAAGKIGIVSPGARPCARSPTGPPPCQTPDRSGWPSARRGTGPCGVSSRRRTLFVSGFALPPAGAVVSDAFSVDDFAGAGVPEADGACAAAPTVTSNAAGSSAERLNVSFILLLLVPADTNLLPVAARRECKDFS